MRGSAFLLRICNEILSSWEGRVITSDKQRRRCKQRKKKVDRSKCKATYYKTPRGKLRQYLQLFLILFSFNCYTSVKRNLYTTIIILHFSVFVYILTFTSDIYNLMFLCCCLGFLNFSLRNFL